MTNTLIVIYLLSALINFAFAVKITLDDGRLDLACLANFIVVIFCPIFNSIVALLNLYDSDFVIWERK